MQEKIETITINNVEYVRKDAVKDMAYNTEGLPFVIIRSDRAGVFAGYLKYHKDQEVELINSIRLWKWSGATLSQVSQEGTPNINNCKFGVTELIKKIMTVIEVIPCTDKARREIEAVKRWRV